MRVEVEPVIFVLEHAQVKEVVSKLCHGNSIAMPAPGFNFPQMLKTCFVWKVRQRLEAEHLEHLVAKGLIDVSTRPLGYKHAGLVLYKKPLFTAE